MEQQPLKLIEHTRGARIGDPALRADEVDPLVIGFCQNVRGVIRQVGRSVDHAGGSPRVPES
jgi:hypothetical protein